MNQPPQQIRAIRNDGIFEIVWEDLGLRKYPFKLVRVACPCAGCVNEFTGERILDPDSVPEEIAPMTVEFSGNYALKIQWSDGHSTGIYTWDLLHYLASAPGVLARTNE